MALMKCGECGKEMSDTATACPACGWKRPRFKWWLWLPLGAGAAFLAYGFSIPEYKARAMQERDLCYKLAGFDQLLRMTCDRNYAVAIDAGQRPKQSAAATVLPSDIVTSEPAPWDKPGSQAKLRKELADCRAREKAGKQDAAACERLDYEFRMKFNVAP